MNAMPGGGYRIVEHARLDARNTFGVHATAPMLVEVADAAALPELFTYAMLRDGPVLVLGATGLVVTVMLVFIVPIFAKIYSDLGAKLPVMRSRLPSRSRSASATAVVSRSSSLTSSPEPAYGVAVPLFRYTRLCWPSPEASAYAAATLTTFSCASASTIHGSGS